MVRQSRQKMRGNSFATSEECYSISVKNLPPGRRRSECGCSKSARFQFIDFFLFSFLLDLPSILICSILVSWLLKFFVLHLFINQLALKAGSSVSVWRQTSESEKKNRSTFSAASFALIPGTQYLISVGHIAPQFCGQTWIIPKRSEPSLTFSLVAPSPFIELLQRKME